jgi:hypothetical protein
VNKKELSQIFFLNNELKMWQEELDKIQSQSIIKGQEITDMPRGGGISDKVGNLASQIADIEMVIRGKLAEIQLERKKIIEYINSISDSQTRQIIFYRCVSCLSWKQVAGSIGGECTERSVRHIFERLFEVSKNEN